jgi:hypothetical protein
MPKMTIELACRRTALTAAAFLCALALVSCSPAQRSSQGGAQDGVTHLRVSSQVILPAVTRLGINLGEQDYYDSGQMVKNLLFRNPGFEGMSYRTIFHCVYGGPGRCLDTRQGIQFPTGFWDGGIYEILDGAAAGQRGTVTVAGPSGNGYAFALDGGVQVNGGDWISVAKAFTGGPTSGWWPRAQGGAQLEPERTDLPPGTPGHQALRMTALVPGSVAQINSYLDSSEGMTFVRLRGRYRLSFKAKALSGSRMLHVHVVRLVPGVARALNVDLPLTAGWAQYNQDFSASEGALPPAAIEVSFSITGGSMLLDDVSLEQTGGDPSNHTIFRDEVVQTLRELHPGVLRMMGSYEELGATIDNLLAPTGARVRSGYRTSYTPTEDISIGIPDFLDLCQAVGAEPWIAVPAAINRDEARKLAEYLSGPASTPGGALRAAAGHPEPWSSAFRTIHIELGNETWNSSYQGETIEDAAAYGRRANMIFTAFRAAAGADAARIDLAVGTQAYFPGRNPALLSAAAQANTIAIAPYLMLGVTQWDSDDQLFGPLLAQPEQMAREGILHATQASAGGRQLAVYEVNLHTTGGNAPESVLDRLTPSAAAGIAVTGHMLRMMRDFGVRDQMLFALPQYRFKRPDGTPVRLWGSVVEMGPTGRKRPQFLAESLANRVLRGDLVRVDIDGDNPTHDQPAGNDGVQLRNVHEIDAYAFQEGRSHGLVLFNYGLHQSRRISIEAPGLSAGSSALLTRLLSPSPSGNNETTTQVTIGQERLQGNDVVLPPCSMAVLEWNE